MQQCLALTTATSEVAWGAMLLQLSDVTPHCAPPFDLPQIVQTAPAGIVTAVPLKPTARILMTNPTFLSPFGKRLRGVHTEIIQRCATSIRRKLRSFEPAGRKFLPAIGHIFSPEHTQLQHLLRSQLRLEPGTKITTHRFGAQIDIALLHVVVYHDAHRSHFLSTLDFRLDSNRALPRLQSRQRRE
jgi:hypothetical protein